MSPIESISRNIANFKKDTLDIDQFLTGTLVSYDFFKNQYPEILKDFTAKNRNIEEKQGMDIFEKLNLNISTYETSIYTFCFINLIARTEAFLNDILETLFLWKDGKNFQELNNDARAKTILKFSHSSFKDKIKFLKDKFGLNFPSIEKHNSYIVELFSTRNIILHNNGHVNATYLTASLLTLLFRSCIFKFLQFACFKGVIAASNGLLEIIFIVCFKL